MNTKKPLKLQPKKKRENITKNGRPIPVKKPRLFLDPYGTKIMSLRSFKSLFEADAGILCTLEEIQSRLKMSASTLEDYCARVYGEPISTVYQRLINGGRMSLRRAQYLSAVKSRNVTMQIWLGKQWLGQRENGSPFGGERNTVEYDIREGLYNAKS